jgi:anti-anti-sigma factor
MPTSLPTVTAKPVGNLTLVTVRGHLKIGHPPLDELRETLRHLADGGQVQLVIDLSEMPAFDSTGIGLLAVGYTSMRKRGGNIKLCGLPDLARQMLKTVGLLNIFEVYDARDEALASWK